MLLNANPFTVGARFGRPRASNLTDGEKFSNTNLASEPLSVSIVLGVRLAALSGGPVRSTEFSLASLATADQDQGRSQVAASRSKTG